jgi:hypothetical protein
MATKTSPKIGTKVRSKTSGISGVITERIVIERGHQITPPPPGAAEYEGGEYAQRVDLRIEYTDDQGKKSEHLIHENDAEPA